MVSLGEISYEIFLLHVLVMALVLGVMLRWPLFTGSLPGLYALTLLITIPLAWALRKLTAPSRQRKRTFSDAKPKIFRPPDFAPTRTTPVRVAGSSDLILPLNSISQPSLAETIAGAESLTA